MNKAELIDKIAEGADVSKQTATQMLEVFMQSITSAISKGDQVSLINFGTWSVKERSARTVRNPRTGELIDVKETKVPAFKAGKALKEAVQIG